MLNVVIVRADGAGPHRTGIKWPRLAFCGRVTVFKAGRPQASRVAGLSRRSYELVEDAPHLGIRSIHPFQHFSTFPIVQNFVISLTIQDRLIYFIIPLSMQYSRLEKPRIFSFVGEAHQPSGHHVYP